MRILIIEDEAHLASTLADILTDAGYTADISGNGRDGLEFARTGIYDAIVLDVMLPQMNGYEILSRLRGEHQMTPVLMLTAKSELGDRVRGLDAGADYYLTKPFENAELLACLRTVLRRQGDILPESLIFSDLTLTPSTCELSCKDHSMTLSAKELELMRLLMVNSGIYLPKETLLLKVWGYDSTVNDNNVEAYISFLRKKLALLGSAVQISVARRVGYRLEVIES